MPTRSKLEIKVWDHDTFSSNELLGELEIDVYEEVQSVSGGGGQPGVAGVLGGWQGASAAVARSAATKRSGVGSRGGD